MSIVVPFAKPQPSETLGNSPSSSSAGDPFALMAAAQMNIEGRLIEPGTEPKADDPAANAREILNMQDQVRKMLPKDYYSKDRASRPMVPGELMNDPRQGGWSREIRGT